VVKAPPAKFALQLAQRLVEERGISALPIDPFAIAQQSGIEVYAKDPGDAGVSGMLIKSADSFAIAFATHIPSEGFQRFSVAHELGHYFTPGHCTELFKAGVTVHSSQAGYRSSNKTEREADEFACGLLMPERLFLAAARKFDDGLGAVESLARMCKTSLVATAIRFVETARSPVAAVVSKDGLIEFCFLSKALLEFPNLEWPKRGTSLPAGTITARISQDSNAVEGGQRDAEEGELQDWVGGPRSVPILEEAIGLGRYGRTLTIITSETYADDLDDDAELIDRWTPKFGR
jgi:Zn-dependent peptidase ImmA (M78 family)